LQKIAQGAALLKSVGTQFVRSATGPASKRRTPAPNLRRALRSPPFLLTGGSTASPAKVGESLCSNCRILCSAGMMGRRDITTMVARSYHCWKACCLTKSLARPGVELPF